MLPVYSNPSSPSAAERVGPQALSKSGEIVGTDTSSTIPRAFVYEGAQLTYLTPLDGTMSQGTGISQ